MKNKLMSVIMLPALLLVGCEDTIYICKTKAGEIAMISTSESNQLLQTVAYIKDNTLQCGAGSDRSDDIVQFTSSGTFYYTDGKTVVRGTDTLVDSIDAHYQLKVSTPMSNIIMSRNIIVDPILGDAATQVSKPDVVQQPVIINNTINNSNDN